MKKMLLCLALLFFAPWLGHQFGEVFSGENSMVVFYNQSGFDIQNVLLDVHNEHYVIPEIKKSKLGFVKHPFQEELVYTISLTLASGKKLTITTEELYTKRYNLFVVTKDGIKYQKTIKMDVVYPDDAPSIYTYTKNTILLFYSLLMSLISS
ncbi:hypothetical protein [Maridesulfovibrio frigidus]|uniref:hypothetical protein n=1 Tax=Maridesulfovibrio frigidus TaxID=340956 RepID=UPI0004E1A10F|nr:hypothetical protein [Maridesulfovibrio frigidus]